MIDADKGEKEDGPFIYINMIALACRCLCSGVHYRLLYRS